jgi:hypothetical protein
MIRIGPGQMHFRTPLKGSVSSQSASRIPTHVPIVTFRFYIFVYFLILGLSSLRAPAKGPFGSTLQRTTTTIAKTTARWQLAATTGRRPRPGDRSRSEPFHMGTAKAFGAARPATRAATRARPATRAATRARPATRARARAVAAPAGVDSLTVRSHSISKNKTHPTNAPVKRPPHPCHLFSHPKPFFKHMPFSNHEFSSTGFSKACFVKP